MVKVDSIFPYPVMIANLSTQVDTGEIDALIDTITTDHESNGQNHIGNSYDVLEGTKLKVTIQRYVDRYSIDLLGEAPKLGITISWLNLNRPGESHHPHYHPNSKVSGCLYLNVDENTGDFLIHRPQYMDESFRDNIVNSNRYNWNYVAYKPKKYDLYLFPSKLRHSVTDNKSTINRISLAFNTFYDETIGNKAELLRR